MTTASELRLRTWDAGQSAPAEIPLHFTGAIAAADLRCLPGASGVHVVLCDANGVRLRVEVVAEPGEVVPLRVEVDEHGAPQLSSPGRNVVHLPAGDRYDPSRPILPASQDAPLDVAIVVDGTTRVWPEMLPHDKEAPAPSLSAIRLLEKNELWAAHVDKLTDLVMRIAEGRDTRIAIVAFGDQEPPAVTARDLRPRYRLYPAEEDRVLQPFDLSRLRDRLLALPSSPGADFVDAAGDALAACVRLRWREAARKLVVLTGDSPGVSLLHPLPKGADLCVRQFDVDTQALALHRAGVEVLTIYHAPARDPGLYEVAFQRDLLLAARTQYERLASLREFAFENGSFDPAAAADRLRVSSGFIARGVALGELVAVAGATRSRRRT